MSGPAAISLATFRPSVATDPNFANVSLLLHGEGADASTTFTDNSINGLTPTVVGDAQIDTAQFKYGAASMLFDGTGDRIHYADSAPFGFALGAWTVECFVRVASLAAGRGLFGVGGAGATASHWLSIQANGSILATIDGSVLGSSAAGLVVVNTWHHVAMVCTGNGTGTVKIYIDGVLALTGDKNNTSQSSGICVVGGISNSGGSVMNGHVDEFRVTKGVARYLSNFTPPSAEFPNS